MVAQCCEIFALKRGLEQLEGKRGIIFTDSRYAYGIVHTFGKIREERGFVNSKGKTLAHENITKKVLEALRKPTKIAVVHVRGHQKRTSLETLGNNLADRAAKEAALEEKNSILWLGNLGEEEMKIPVFNEQEQKEL